jgi:signal transduction histidine kinase
LPQQQNGIRGLAEDADGVLLVSLDGGVARFVDGQLEIAYGFPRSIRQFQFPLPLRDRNGGLWLGGSTGGGLVHFHQGTTDTFSSTEGLSGDAVYKLFEDREGNIWVATTEGLDRFRNMPVATYSVKQGLTSARVTSVLAARDGSIWMGTSVELNRWDRGHVTSPWRPANLVGVGSIFQDSLQRVWASTDDEVGYLDASRFVTLERVGGGLIRWIAEDIDANVWIANAATGLFRFSLRTGHIDHTRWDTLEHGAPATAMAADRSMKGVWLGFRNGVVKYFADGQVRASYGTAEGIGNGLRSLYLDRDGAVWVSSDMGLSRVKNGRVATLTVKNGLPCDGIEWLVEDDDRALWVGTRCGLVRLARADLAAWVTAVDTEHNARRAIKTTVFDSTDGVRIFLGASYHSQPAAKASDGRLWFTSQEGVSVVDPRALPYNSLPPPVRIEQFVADRKAYAADGLSRGDMRLPALTRDLRIDYTALTFVAPERAVFRYKLEGRDADWQDVGTRRQAFYNDLPPGSYQFRVIAANDSGVWNETGDSLEFSIAPAYYQTSWFLALSVVSIVALIWTAHRVRLRVVERHQREISALNERTMKAQEQERIRIAGELHDGVMQDMLAATMMLGTTKRRISDDPDAAKATLDKVQQKLIQAGTDLRQLSHGLHPPLLQEAGLPGALTAYCEQFSTTWGIPVSCDADDSARELSRGAALALFRILQEALGNAAKHAAAKNISVRLQRSNGTVSLTVSDDGVGFDAGRLASGGGLGLVMMRERAGQLNGTFDFESAPGRGTTISVVIPFR